MIQRLDRGLCAYQKCILLFTRFEFERSAERYTSQYWRREEFALGQDAVEVFNQHGNKLHVRPVLGEMEKATFEGGHFPAGLPSAFRKND